MGIGNRVANLAKISQVYRQLHSIQECLPLVALSLCFEEAVGRSEGISVLRRANVATIARRSRDILNDCSRLSIQTSKKSFIRLFSDSELDHRLKLLGNHRLRCVGLELGRFHFERDRKCRFFRRGIDRIAETDVNLELTFLRHPVITEISRDLPIERASIRFARLAHAIKNTRPTAPHMDSYSIVAFEPMKNPWKFCTVGTKPRFVTG
jgi:hypothetical protein